MKTTILGLAATAVLLLTATTAHANDRGFRDNGNAAWRLGERNRDGYSIYRRQGGNWYRVPGSGIAVGDGWVLGNKRENGGYAIYRWNGHDWDQAPGGAVEIGGTYNRPWVINDRGQRFNWNVALIMIHTDEDIRCFTFPGKECRVGRQGTLHINTLFSSGFDGGDDDVFFFPIAE